MLYDFLCYAYSLNITKAILMAVVGIIEGLIFSRNRKKKGGTITLHTMIWLCILYPMIIAGEYNRYHNGKVACKENPEYVMVRDVCYQPVTGYIPYNTWYINKDVGDAVKETTDK